MPTISGTSGNDTLVGSEEADTLYGGGGDDVLNGGGGNDILYAGNLPGGGSGATKDTLNGGAGDDVAVWTMDTWITNFDGGDGFDTADYSAYNQSAFFFAQPLTFQVGANGEIEASAFIFQRGQSGYNQVIGSFTNVERIITTQYGAVNLGDYTRGLTIDGSAQADRITTGSGRDTIRGGAGADAIKSGADRDVVQGGQGDDTLDGGADIDTVDYSDATSAVRVDLAAGTATGGAGNDTLANFERVVGSNFDDALIGSGNDDSLSGGRGADILTGGAGRDEFRFAVGDSTASSTDSIVDFAPGDDRLIFNGAATGYSIVRQGAGSVVFVSYASGAQTVVTLNAAVSAGDLLRDADFNYLSVGATMVGLDGGSDNLIGGTVDDLIYGQAGDDVIIGGVGADALSGGAGADTFLYRSVTESTDTYNWNNVAVRPGYDNLFDFETGIDNINVAAIPLSSISIIRQDGSSFLFGGINGSVGSFQLVAAGRAINANDLTGYSGGVYLVGSGADDVLVGGAGADGIIGNDGVDIITGGIGADALGGGAGADVFRYVAQGDSNAAGYDNLFDFQTGIDKIDFTTLNTTAISIVRQGGSSFLFANTTGGAMQLVAAGRDINGADLTYAAANGVSLIGSSIADTLIGGDKADILSGGAGNDVLHGGAGSDILTGGAGADVFHLRGYGFAPTGGDTDTITDFETGVDKIVVDSDLVSGTLTIQRLENGDSLVSGQFSPLPSFPAGPLSFTATGRDINASDVSFLGSGAAGFSITGSTRADTLIGSNNSDTIQGGAGADIIVGGGSSDTLFGGSGADVFRYFAAVDSRYGTRALDRIQDFVSGTDKIDLSTARTGQNDVFGIAYLNGDAHLFVDLGGDGFNDLEIIVTQATLLNSDIIWGSGTGSSSIESLGKDNGPEVLPVDGSEADGLSGRPALFLSSRDGGMLTLHDPSMPVGCHYDQSWWI